MALSLSSFRRHEEQRQSVLLTIILICCSLQASKAAKTAHLIFRADCQFVSDPFPVLCPSEFEDFWSQESTRNLLLSAGGRRTCRSVETCEHTHDLWVRACQKTYGSDHLPQSFFDPNHYGHRQDCPTVESMMATDTEVKFPGSQIYNTVLNGCKLHHDQEGRPSYTFCLIGDHKSVKGNPSIVWLVKKLTGMSSVPKSHDEFSFEESETIAKTQIRIIPESASVASASVASEVRAPRDENHDIMMKLQMTVQFATHLQFPERFLGILPMPKEKVEQKGSRSMRKVVERDAVDALKAVREAWLSRTVETTSTRTNEDNDDADAHDTLTRQQQDNSPQKVPVRQRIRSFRQRFAQARV